MLRWHSRPVNERRTGRRLPFQRLPKRDRSVGVLLALVVGAAIGEVARAIAPHHVPRRADVRIISSVVGALLGGLGLAISRWSWEDLTRLSTGSAVASALGAIAMLLAFHVCPRIVPSVTQSLPGRGPVVKR